MNRLNIHFSRIFTSPAKVYVHYLTYKINRRFAKCFLFVCFAFASTELPFFLNLNDMLLIKPLTEKNIKWAAIKTTKIK